MVQEVVIEGQDKVYKDVIEPLESVSVNLVSTSKQNIKDFGPPKQVCSFGWNVNNILLFVLFSLKKKVWTWFLVTDRWNTDKESFGPSKPENKTNWCIRGLLSFVN